MSALPVANDLGDDENTHENGVDPEDANILCNQGERYSRSPAGQASLGASPHHRPSNRRSAPPHESRSKGKWQDSPKKPSRANPMLAASIARHRDNESTTRMHKDICN